MYDLQRLRTLRELKNRGTLAAVARALSYTPSAISQQLAQLEAEVGVPLLEHVGRRVRLTEQAEILVSHTETVLRQLEAAEADVAASLSRVGCPIHLAAFQSAALTIVPEALVMLRDRYPELRAHVHEMEPQDALPALLARDFDLIIAQDYPGVPCWRPEGAEAQDLLDDPLYLAVPPGLNLTSETTWREVAGMPWVMEPEGADARSSAMMLCRSAGFEPDVRFVSSDIVFHVRLVEAGLAVALVPGLPGPERLSGVTLHQLPSGRRTRRIFTVVRGGHQGHPAIVALRTALRQAVEARRLAG